MRSRVRKITGHIAKEIKEAAERLVFRDRVARGAFMIKEASIMRDRYYCLSGVFVTPEYVSYRKLLAKHSGNVEEVVKHINEEIALGRRDLAVLENDIAIVAGATILVDTFIALIDSVREPHPHDHTVGYNGIDADIQRINE
jgi:hypothetical protein